MKKQDLKEWHRIICEKANWHCQVCGKFGDRQTLCGHHLLTRGAYPGLRHDTDNGIATCLRCHHDIHSGLIKLNPKRLEKIIKKLNDLL